MVILWERCNMMFFSREYHWHQWFFDGFAPLWPSPLTTFLITDHWVRWFFNGSMESFNHRHLMIFSPQTIVFNGFLMVFRFCTPMVNDGFEKHPKKYMIPFIFDEIWNAILEEAVVKKEGGLCQSKKPYQKILRFFWPFLWPFWPLFDMIWLICWKGGGGVWFKSKKSLSEKTEVVKKRGWWSCFFY